MYFGLGEILTLDIRPTTMTAIIVGVVIVRLMFYYTASEIAKNNKKRSK